MKNLLENILKLLFNLTNWLQKEIRTRYKSQNIIINTLAPKVLTEVEDVKRIKPYLDSLKAAIDTDNINNIAITGSYGSGKSTIIKTFQNRHPEYEYLNISLASFSDNKGDEEIERKLEISILQQMFYHVKPSDIPDSRFKRIVNLTNKHLVIHALLLIVWSLSALILIKFKYIDKLNPSTWNVNYDFDLVTFLSTSIFFVGIGFFIKSVYRLFSNSKINKLNIKGELELGEAVDKSVFNQHLEEILYFFERKKYNVVVIEDVDRFNSTDIFTKLREINILINSSKLINRSVKFVYAIKDEMFLDKNDRVKFFEFIIPVISFINPGNANDQLEKLINDANLQGQLSSSFTSDIVTFIDDIDMRLLINIFQEFQIYRNILSNSLSADKLFAILVYKNMYPDDYGELAKRKGKLYRFLTNKKEYIKDLLREIELKIDGIGKHIAFLEKEELASVEELRAVYINCLVAKLKNFQSFYFGTNVSIADAVKEEYFRQLQDGITYIEFAKDRYSDRYSLSDSPVKADKKLSDIEKEVNPSLTYSQREKLLFDKKNNATETLKKEREHLLKTSQGVLAYSIQEVFTSKDIAPYLGDFSNSYLMRNLLLNGHIDEHYEDYTTLFHGVSITQADFEFERHVKSGINSPPDYGLSKIENLIKKLPVRYFKGEAIWNYALLDWLLNNHNKYKDKLDFFYEGLKDNSEKQFKFINSYIKRNPAKLASFIANLCYTKPGLWQYIDSKSGLPADEIRSLVKLIFEYAKKESILGFDNVKQLEAYIKKMPDFFAFCASLNHSHVIQAFVVERSLKIEKLDLPTDAQKQIFGDVYNKNAYTINEHNLVAILKGNGIDYNLEEFEKSQYTTIQKLDLKPLQEYISSDICDYVINVMTTSKGNQYEAEKTILDILNREDIKESVKEKLLESQSTLIQDIN
ncbi:MAG: TniB family NTP-binding protein, partial [Bacteroidota bacterium]